MSTSYKLSAAAFWKVYFTHLFINNARITNMFQDKQFVIIYLTF